MLALAAIRSLLFIVDSNLLTALAVMLLPVALPETKNARDR
jgi:hypothetical protein